MQEHWKPSEAFNESGGSETYFTRLDFVIAYGVEGQDNKKTMWTKTIGLSECIWKFITPLKRRIFVQS
jgi:hypothetical protein